NVDPKVSIEQQRSDFWSYPNACAEITRNQPAIQKRLLKHPKAEAAEEKVVSFN
ncbi:hypothetical protein HK100_007375, partial [Physocladia obscura]